MKWLLLGLAAAVAMPSAANATAFMNGDFELGVDTGPWFTTLEAGSTALTGWTILSGSIDYKGDYWQAGDGKRSIDLNGNSAGAISQTFDTVAGTSYIVDFLLSGNPDGSPVVKTLEVSATGNAATQYLFDTTGLTHGDMGWEGRTYQFIATGASTTLTFASLTAGNFYGPALDAISVAPVSVVPVPEPATWAMMIGGLAAVGTTMRRRRTTIQFA